MCFVTFISNAPVRAIESKLSACLCRIAVVIWYITDWSAAAYCCLFIYHLQILIHHIRDCLPEIKSKLNTMMLSVHQELGELGEPTDTVSQSSLGATLLTLLSKFATNFQVILIMLTCIMTCVSCCVCKCFIVIYTLFRVFDIVWAATLSRSKW